MLKIIKGAVLNAVGLPATEDMIKQHVELESQLHQLQDDLKKLEVILNNLKVKYTRYKHQIFFIRYRLMRRMIKSAVERVRQELDDTENQSTESEVEGQGPLMEFCKNAKALAAHDKKYYSELSAKQVGEDLCNFKAKIKQLKEEFSKKRELLEQLGKNYQKSKILRYPQRYEATKQMIKNTFSD